MRMGILFGPILDGANTNALAEQVHAYLGAGFDSIWSAQAIGRGFMMSDPLMALTVAANLSDKVELGTGILQLPLYHPMEVAHRIFTLHQMCGDRLILGVGAGSTQADYDAYGRDYDGRFKAFNETLATLRDIFETGGTGGANHAPWPAIKGGPKLAYGTWGKGVARAAREFDVWIASGMHRTPDEVCAVAPEYRAAGGKRAIVTTINVSGETDLGKLKADLDQYAEAGFDDAVILPLPGIPSLDQVRKLVD